MSEIPNQNHVVTLPVRCGTCVFFKTLKNKKYSDICQKLGITRSGRPCKEYLNDSTNLNPREEKGKRVSKALSLLDNADLNALASLAKQEITTRKQGFRLGQTVYIRIYPGEYVSNYISATVIQANKNGVFVTGNGNVRGLLLKESVLTSEQWIMKKTSLEKRKRLVDPKLKEYTKVKKVVDILDIESSINDLDLLHQEKAQNKKTQKINVRTSKISTLINLRGG